MIASGVSRKMNGCLTLGLNQNHGTETPLLYATIYGKIDIGSAASSSSDCSSNNCSSKIIVVVALLVGVVGVGVGSISGAIMGK